MKKSLGLLGIGRWGKNIARNFYELGVLDSIYDPCEENVRNHTKNFVGISFCRDEDEIFSNSNIDKVAIVTRVTNHTKLILKALKAKKDVFVEKPICLDLKEAELINETAKENNRIVMVGHILHYHPVVIKLKELIDQGYIGDLVSIEATRVGLGYIKEEMNSLWGFATHDISLILSIIKTMPESVLTLTNEIFDRRGSDLYNCFLGFSNNVKAHIKVNWFNPYKEQRFIINGTEGLILFDDTERWNKKLKVFNKPEINENNTISLNQFNEFKFVEVKYEEPLKNECKYFLQCCENRKEPYTNVNESINVMEIIKSLLNSVSLNPFLSNAKGYFVQASVNI